MSHSPVVRVQEPLPDRYLEMSEAEIDARITEARKTLGSALVILGHHYQRDEVIKFADYTGDSLRLARCAADRQDAPYIVFCGVHFMAETADILTTEEQAVILPDLGAGCSMADMASMDEVEECWNSLVDCFEDDIVPVAYVNSSAVLKAFCGAKGGITCTSSNAPEIFRWAFEHGRRILFFPDEHLGRNTGVRLGIPMNRMAVWNREEERLVTKEGDGADNPLLILWNGFCSVHMRFTVEQIQQARERFTGIRVIVHPECCYEVVRLADEVGSTEYIRRRIAESPSGSRWAVGTEINLVHRLAKQQPDKLIISLDECVYPCVTMYRINPQNLLWVLDNLVEGRVVNQIRVPAETAKWAKVALDRMLSVT